MLVSVIIPVYNVEQYLPQCVGSVLAQTMRDFELLLIDDGSTDRSGALCDQYAARDARIKVFHLKNGGASQARNFGLDHAAGEFVVFVDSDDWIEPDHLQQFIRSGIGEDGIAFTNIYEERAPRKRRQGRIRTMAVPDARREGGRKACMPVFVELLRVRCFGWTCNKMFSRKTIERHHLRFDRSLRYAEDEIFTAQYCAYVTHVVSSSHPTYHYRYVPGSLLHKRLDPLMLMQTRRSIHRQYEQAEYCDEMLYLTTRTQFSRLRRELRRAAKWDSEVADKLAQGILDNWKLYRKYSRAEFRRAFYDMKSMWLGWITCSPGSRFWVKFIIKGLHV